MEELVGAFFAIVLVLIIFYILLEFLLLIMGLVGVLIEISLSHWLMVSATVLAVIAFFAISKFAKKGVFSAFLTFTSLWSSYLVIIATSWYGIRDLRQWELALGRYLYHNNYPPITLDPSVFGDYSSFVLISIVAILSFLVCLSLVRIWQKIFNPQEEWKMFNSFFIGLAIILGFFLEIFTLRRIKIDYQTGRILNTPPLFQTQENQYAREEKTTNSINFNKEIEKVDYEMEKKQTELFSGQEKFIERETRKEPGGSISSIYGAWKTEKQTTHLKALKEYVETLNGYLDALAVYSAKKQRVIEVENERISLELDVLKQAREKLKFEAEIQKRQVRLLELIERQMEQGTVDSKSITLYQLLVSPGVIQETNLAQSLITEAEAEKIRAEARIAQMRANLLQQEIDEEN